LPFLAGVASLIFMAWLFNRVWTAGRRARDRAEALAARALGLRPAAQDTSGRVEFEGTIDGYRVVLERIHLENRVRIAVDGGGRIPRAIRLGAADRTTWIEELTTAGVLPGPGDRVRSGIPERERERAIMNLFGPRYRGRLVNAVKNLGIEVSGGEVFREVEITGSSSGLAKRIRHTVRLADMLARETLPACRRAVSGRDPRLRLEVARLVEAQGLSVLLELATDGEVPEEVAVEALRNLNGANDRPRSGAALMCQVEKGHGEPRLFAIEALGEMKHGPAVEPLTRLVGDVDEATAVAAANALGAIGDARAEEALIAALSSNRTEIQIAAAQALAAVGTVAAVEPLLALGSVGRLLGTRLYAAARQAVERIQARLPGAEAGRLTLVGPAPESGALSLGAEERAGEGALSIAKGRKKPRARA
jgi:hypothetical protein